MGPGLVTECQRRRCRSTGIGGRRRPGSSGFAAPTASLRPLRSRLSSPRVLLVAPPSTWHGYEDRLQEEGEINLLCQVSQIRELGRYLALHPDAIVADVNAEAAAELRDLVAEWRIPVIFLGGSEHRLDEVSRLPKGGAILPRECGSAEVAAAIRASMAGLVSIDPRVLAAVHVGGHSEGEDRSLSTREREVLNLIAAGMPNKQIALKLGISPHTAKFHVAGVLQKLGAASRTEAVSTGVRRGLLSL